MRDATLYDGWELSRPEVNGRSYLVHLPPIGIGTAAVESLTGYIARLAAAHAVETGVLVNRELLPRIPCTKGARRGSFREDAGVLVLYERARAEWVGRPFATLGFSARTTDLHSPARSSDCSAMGEHDFLRASAAPTPGMVFFLLDGAFGNRIRTLALGISGRHCLPRTPTPARHGLSLLRPDAVCVFLKARPGHCSRCQSWLGREPKATLFGTDIGVRSGLPKWWASYWLRVRHSRQALRLMCSGRMSAGTHKKPAVLSVFTLRFTTLISVVGLAARTSRAWIPLLSCLAA